MTASNPGGLSSAATGAETQQTTTPDPATPGLERVIARLLTYGTYSAVACLVVGLALLLGAGIAPLSGGPAFDPGTLVGDLVALQPAGFLWLGLLVVVATPSARVLASLVGYARRGERSMAIVAALILLVIAVSVALAKTLEA